MAHSADSGPLALPRDEVPDRVPAWPPDGKRSLNAAEVAQARIFEEVLRAEISQLEQLASTMVDRGMRFRERRIGDSRSSEELMQLRVRIDEAHRLLETLRRRFLYQPGRDGPGTR